MKKEIGLSFGITAGSIEDQLKKQGFKLSDRHLKMYQKAIDGWNILRFKAFMTDSESDKIAQRIIKSISKDVVKI